MAKQAFIKEVGYEFKLLQQVLQHPDNQGCPSWLMSTSMPLNWFPYVLRAIPELPNKTTYFAAYAWFSTQLITGDPIISVLKKIARSSERHHYVMYSIADLFNDQWIVGHKFSFYVEKTADSQFFNVCLFDASGRPDGIERLLVFLYRYLPIKNIYVVDAPIQRSHYGCDVFAINTLTYFSNMVKAGQFLESVNYMQIDSAVPSASSLKDKLLSSQRNINCFLPSKELEEAANKATFITLEDSCFKFFRGLLKDCQINPSNPIFSSLSMELRSSSLFPYAPQGETLASHVEKGIKGQKGMNLNYVTTALQIYAYMLQDLQSKTDAQVDEIKHQTFNYDRRTNVLVLLIAVILLLLADSTLELEICSTIGLTH